jgi:hypothetical protein
VCEADALNIRQAQHCTDLPVLLPPHVYDHAAFNWAMPAWHTICWQPWQHPWAAEVISNTCTAPFPTVPG